MWTRIPLPAALLALVAAAGCTPETGSPSSAPTTPAAETQPPSPTIDPVAQAEQEVLAAYRCMWDAYDQAGRAPVANPDDERLGQCAAGSALEALETGLAAIRDRDELIDGEVVMHPEVTDIQLDADPPTAEVTDCGDSTNWLTVDRETGEPTDQPRGRQRVVADLELLDDDWKVTVFGVLGVGSC